MVLVMLWTVPRARNTVSTEKCALIWNSIAVEKPHFNRKMTTIMEVLARMPVGSCDQCLRGGEVSDRNPVAPVTRPTRKKLTVLGKRAARKFEWTVPIEVSPGRVKVARVGPVLVGAPERVREDLEREDPERVEADLAADESRTHDEWSQTLLG